MSQTINRPDRKRGCRSDNCYDDPNRTQDIKLKSARKRFWVDRFVIARSLLGGRVLISVKLTSFWLFLGWHYSLDADQNQVRDC